MQVQAILMLSQLEYSSVLEDGLIYLQNLLFNKTISKYYKNEKNNFNWCAFLLFNICLLTSYTTNCLEFSNG